MDLSNPLATVAPTLDAGVLQVLAATTAGCTTGEVHRRLGRGSDEGVRRVLARLDAQGVVVVETAGRYPVYRLNREHVAAPYIEALSAVRREIIDRIGRELAGWQLMPAHAGLFGSFARATADADSDVDVLIVRQDGMDAAVEDAWLDQLAHLQDKIRAWTGNAAQLVDLSPSTLGLMVRQNDPLVDSWRAEEVHLHGERLLDLLRRLR
jgi:predicted nucleotidyltransferase